jgi:predicted nucleic acid-binding protein
MFANRFTALIDACTLVSALKRNLLLTLAEAEFFRVRWSNEILNETETAIASLLSKRGSINPKELARKARASMESAFEDANVGPIDEFLFRFSGLPDPNDAHVLAAAVKTRADVLVTENVKDFPEDFLKPFSIELKTADAFIADTISLGPGPAVEAIRTMRNRLSKPAITPEYLLIAMEKEGMVWTVDSLRPYAGSL